MWLQRAHGLWSPLWEGFAVAWHLVQADRLQPADFHVIDSSSSRDKGQKQIEIMHLQVHNILKLRLCSILLIWCASTDVRVDRRLHGVFVHWHHYALNVYQIMRVPAALATMMWPLSCQFFFTSQSCNMPPCICLKAEQKAMPFSYQYAILQLRIITQYLMLIMVNMSRPHFTRLQELSCFRTCKRP